MMMAVLHSAQDMVTPIEPGESPRQGVRLGDTPTLSVVVTSAGSASILENCLEVMLPVCAQIGADVLVVRAGESSGVSRALMAAHPRVRLIQAPAGMATPDLRRLGMGEAGGDLIMFQADDAVSADWIPPRLLAKPRAES